MNSTSLQYTPGEIPTVSARTQVGSVPANATVEPASTNVVGVDPPAGQNVRWLNYVDKRLKDFSERPEVSDDPEAYQKPPAEAVASARRIAWTYFGAQTPTPNVVPSVQGGVDFVWYKGDWHLKIQVLPEGASIWAHNLSNGKLWAGSLDDNSEELRKLLVELSGVR